MRNVFYFSASLFAVALAACSSAPQKSLPIHETFDGDGPVAPHWLSKAAGWQLVDGMLYTPGSRNVPLWLDAALPADVRVSFEAVSKSPAVDIKFEIFGDGQAHQSGYVVIFCGWHNSKSIIARFDEHGPERSDAQAAKLKSDFARAPEQTAKAHAKSKAIRARAFKGEMGKRYAMVFERQGNTLRFFVDGKLHLEYFDPAPLADKGHDRFGFSSWASDVYFDNLKIEAL